jgi:small-conductance mechanosensitive channel
MDQRRSTARVTPRRLAALAVTLWLAAAAGGATAQEPPPAPQPSAQDTARAERLRRAFAQVPSMREITVAVSGDVVTLAGSAASPAARDNAVAIARKLDDVLWVDDQVQVTAEVKPAAAVDGPSAEDEQLQRRLTSILRQVDALGDVTATVRSGVVHLRGETSSKALQEEIGALARAQPGAALVVNDIALSRDVRERLTPSLDKVADRLREWLAGLPIFAVAILVLAIFWGLSALAGRTAPVYRRLTSNRMLQDVLRQATRIVILMFGFFLALEILGATALVGGVLGTAGVVGLTIGFAFRDIVENYLASIILSVRRPFRGNDLVKIGDHLGTVIRLSASDTVLMAPDGNHLHLPNAMVFKSPIVNLTRNPMRRFDFVAGISAEADLEQAQDLGVQILSQMAGVVRDPKPFARIEALGESNVAVRFFGWVDQTSADFSKVHSEAIRLVKSALEAHGIELPVPIQRMRIERAADKEPLPPRPSLEQQKAEAKRVDVTIQDDLGEQVARDRRASADKDLLSQ